MVAEWRKRPLQPGSGSPASMSEGRTKGTDREISGHRRGGENGAVLGHLGVNVPDLERAAAYYGQLMPLLDYEPFLTADDAIAFMPADGKRGAYLFLYQATVDRGFTREATGLQHLAF